MRSFSPGLVALALGALTLAPDALAGGGDLDFGLFTGVVIPGANHELFSPTTAHYKSLNPGPALGGRASFHPHDLLATEGELYGAVGSAPDAGAALIYALRAQLLFLPPLTLPADMEPFLAAGIGDIGISSSNEVLGSDMDWAFHLGLGTLVPVSEKLGLRFDVRYLLADRNISLSTPGGHTEVLIGMNYRIAKQGDEDGDGFVDSRDGCINASETENGYLDDDGCPDELAELTIVVQDSDGVPMADVIVSADGREIGRTAKDGTLNTSGLMPETTVTLSASHFHMASDAESTLTLVEGKNETTLLTEWLPGRVRVVTRGAAGPILDAAASFIGPKDVETTIVENGDQVFFLAPGEWSVIVAAATFGTERRDLEIAPDEDSLVVIEVELEPAKVEVTREEMVILDKILFEFNSASIDTTSLDLIQEVANNIVVHGGIKKIEVQGHTDSTGPAAANKKLSQERVESVRTELIARGVDGDILTAVGYGEDEPIAPNTNEEGRAKNRRVQFLILEQDLSGGGDTE
jgi:outer membrane protein OmpA-like peptidoglycan-associated protein